MWRGIACSPSRVAPKTIGSAMSDIIAPAVRKERPKTAPPSAVNDIQPNRPCWNSARPKIARTMSGVPATTSIPDSTARASQLARPPPRPPVLAHPERGRDGQRTRDAEPDDLQEDRAEDRVQEAPGLRLVD